jgi:hypothetical protein
MPAVDSVTFDATGLAFEGERNGVRAWFTEDGDLVTLHYFPDPPPIPVDLRDLDAVRDFYRTTAMRGGAAIIEVDTVAVQGCTAVRTIVKIPQAPHGITYVGSITVPFRSCSFVLKIQCAEYGTTGIRDAVIADELIGQGRLAFDPRAGGWMQDPYDTSLTDGFRRNVSEDAQYDARFPTHPLSRLRPRLARLQDTIQFGAELQRQGPFSAPQPPTRRWWQVW